MIEMLPCAIGSIPGVGSQGMSSGAAGAREPANVSPSPPGSPLSLTLKKSDCAVKNGSVSRPTRRASFAVLAEAAEGEVACRSGPEDVAAADGTDVARDRRRRSNGRVDGLSRIDRGSPVVASCQSVAACSQRKKRKKENRCSRGEPHGLLLRGDSLILPASGLWSKARPESSLKRGKFGQFSPFSYRIEAAPPPERTMPRPRNRACVGRPRTRPHGEFSGTAAR
jgi:hypothetical protein